MTCAIIGVIAIWRYKTETHRQHLTSWHSCIGVTALVYVAFEFCGGFLHLFPHRVNISTNQLRKFHAASGLMGYSLTSLSLVSGFSQMFNGLMSEDIVKLIIFGTCPSM